MAANLKVVDLPGTLPNDIPRMLRSLADDIDAGRENLEDVICIATNADSELQMWFWGMHKRGGYHTVGMIESAKFKLAGDFTE